MCASSRTPLIADGTGASSFVSGLAAKGSVDRSEQRDRAGVGPLVWPWIGLLALVGFLGVYPQLSKLWEIWTSDPLRSIGIFILPISIVLIIRVWRESGWELRGSWWGLIPVGLAFAPLICGRQLDFFWVVRGVRVNFFPNVLPVCLYAAGVVLLFAGSRVLRRAWFPLALLLCIQPVPEAFVHYCDLPMQGLSAHIARSFANLLGFPPTNAELLRLMFAPDFGMFIAPGCDGMRGAITLAYVALVLGYLKRLSLLRWCAYVAGALLLGHLFNLIRLCALVLYYRIALGHAVLEGAAKQADYVIGALLFMIATLLFLWILFRKQGQAGTGRGSINSSKALPAGDVKLTQWRAGVLAVFVLTAVGPAVRAIRISSENLAWPMRQSQISAAELNERVPTQVGEYRLVRAWQEVKGGHPLLESAEFEKASQNEIELGVWLAPTDHSIQQSMLTHGETPKTKATAWFSTASGRSVPFETALYDDGVTDTLTGDAYCSPSLCQSGLYEPKQGIHLTFTATLDHTTRGKRIVPMFFKIQVPHTGSGNEAEREALSIESAEFLSHLDLTQISERFQ